jgi:hypothetical protein
MITAVNHIEVLLVSSTYVTCFSRTGHPQAIKYTTLKPKVKFIYFKICEISQIIQAIINNLYVSLKYKYFYISYVWYLYLRHPVLSVRCQSPHFSSSTFLAGNISSPKTNRRLLYLP